MKHSFDYHVTYNFDFKVLSDFEWVGPMNRIWDDQQCKKLGTFYPNLTIPECKDKCQSTEGCTAINYGYENPIVTHSCVLRACSLPVPTPTWNYFHRGAYFQGYYLKPRKIYTQKERLHLLQ